MECVQPKQERSRSQKFQTSVMVFCGGLVVVTCKNILKNVLYRSLVAKSSQLRLP